MSFIAPNSPDANEENDNTSIENHPFFSVLSLSAFRNAMRVDSVTTPERANHALQTAMLEVNGRLWAWADRHMSEGIESITDTPPLPGHPEGANEKLYLAAVWSLAKAQLIERYRDYDTTASGNKNADNLEPSAADYRRDAAWAINDLTGTPRATVELI